jgi:peptide/nickel transport system substrate-binding protein
VPSDQNTLAISLNLAHQNPVKPQVFQNKDFRIGLSHAIDRQEIIDLVFVGLGEPAQLGPLREAPFHSEQLSKQYTEYDVALANDYLDLAGYSERDGQGYRLGPDGNSITFTLETFDNQVWVDILELVH